MLRSELPPNAHANVHALYASAHIVIFACSLPPLTSCSSRYVQLLALYTLPFKHPTHTKRQTTACNRQHKTARYRLVIRHQHPRQLLRRNNTVHVSSTSCHHQGWVHALCLLRNLLDQGITENILRDRYRYRSSQRVKKDSHSIADGHVFLTQHHLDRDEGQLHARAAPDTSDELVADPVRC